MADLPALFASAVACHRQGRFGEAEALYGQLLDAAPDHPDSLHLLGVLSAQTGRNGRAVALIGRAVELRGNVAAYHANLAKALRAEGRAAEAAASLRRALELQPSADSAFSLANALKDLGRFAEAEAWYGTAIRLQPDLADAHLNHAGLLAALGRGGAAVRAAYRRAVACRPDGGGGLRGLGGALHRQGRFAEAERVFLRALRLQPDQPDLLVDAGLARRDAGRAGDGVRGAELAVALAPGEPRLQLHLAESLAAAGEAPRALDAHRRLSRLDPRDATPWQRQAELLEAAGDWPALATLLREVARRGRAGAFPWKTAYYLTVRGANRLLRANATERAERLLAAAADAFGGMDAELLAWVRFLQAGMADRRDDTAEAQRLYALAEPHLPFLVHARSAADLAAGFVPVDPALRAAFEDAFVPGPAPQPEPGGTVVFAACDGRYLERFGRLFLAALERFSAPGQIVHLHVVDPRADTPQRLDALAAGLRVCRLAWSLERSDPRLPEPDRITLYTCARFLRLPRIAALYGAPLLVADIDAVVLDDPRCFTAGLGADRPLALQYFPENLARLYDGIGGGLVVLRPEPAVLALFDRVRDVLLHWLERRCLRYFLDQMALVMALDAAQRRGEAPGVERIGAEGRRHLLNGGEFVQILTEKDGAGFAATATAFLDRLDRDDRPGGDGAADAAARRAWFLEFLGVA